MSEAYPIFAHGETRRSAPGAGWLRWVFAAAIGAALVLAVQRFEKHPAPPPPGGRAHAAAADPIGEGRNNAIVQAAQIVGPSVVSITAVETRIVENTDPFSFFFGQGYREQVPKYGSGFIFDNDGHILTNSHVVSAASEIQVSLPDGRQFKGKVLGADPGYDVAVVKISGSDLKPAPIGNSDDLVVGEWAIAVGNPFGYLLGDTHPSVTVGVISAVNRNINTNVSEGGVYKNMIQTDAAINPGNSGGPLVNSNGEVVGINTFIFTQGGGSLGIGFAIPIKTAIDAANEIIKFGKVRGVYLGITVTALNPYLGQRLGVEDLRGLVVYSLEKDSPAARAGIQVGDIIRAVEGQPVADPRTAYRQIFGSRPGDTIRFQIERNGQRKEIAVTLEPGR